MSKQFSISPRAVPSWTLRVSVPFAALVAAAIIGGSILALSGSNPLEAYRTMVDASFNGLRPATRTLTLATPLIRRGSTLHRGRDSFRVGTSTTHKHSQVNHDRDTSYRRDSRRSGVGWSCSHT